MGRTAALISTTKALTVNQYQNLARQTDRTVGKAPQSLDFPLLGLFGEAGSLLSKLKKKQRDADSYIGYEMSVVEELGMFSGISLIWLRAQISVLQI